MKKFLIFPFSLCLIIFTFVSAFAEIPREYFHKKCDTFGEIPSRADSVHSFDALSYEINLQLFPETEYISGNVIAKIQIEEDNLTEISYELEQLNVDSVFVNSNLAEFSYDSEKITITLDQSYNVGDTIFTRVFYQGEPTLSSDVYHTGIHWGTYIYTFSDPNGARFWFPCYDHPWDKATTKMNLTVPDDLLVASNGILENEIDNEDSTKTFCWNNSDQIATYLVSICVGNYATFEQDYEDIPIINYTYPAHLNATQSDYACIPTAMAIYENLYGDYPFQKYGAAECGIFSGFGAMEHQTMTSIGSGLINGQATYEMIYVHELAHQWFGDCLTPLTWKDVWLSEGFATYSEALYEEETEGFDAMCDYVESSFHNYYLNWAGSTAYTTYDPPYNDYFTPATYEKPASVLHMLRLMVGDEAFFEILQTYFETYKNKNVITTDFIEMCENISEMELQEFFDDWIFGNGVPSFEFYYLKDSPGFLHPNLVIVTRSISNTDTDFEMQIPFEVQTLSGVDSLLTDVGPEFTYHASHTSDEIIDVQFDPHNWMLDRGCTEILPILNFALPGDNFVTLSWEEFPYLLFDSFYFIYRSEISGYGYEKIGEVPSTETTYIDTTVINENRYYYVISYGVNWFTPDGGYNGETEFSNELSATPIPFPMDSGILVVDETMDGSGAPASPTDESVDSLYQYAMQNYNITEYDYASEGSIDIEFLANYSTIIWHDDDLSQHLIENEIGKLSSLLMSGGNLIISGWKTGTYLPEFFLQDFFDLENAEIIPDVDFLGALGENDYPYIDVNGEFIPVWNDQWAYVTMFQAIHHQNILYKYDSSSEENAGTAVGIVDGEDEKHAVVLGFPLYFMQQDDVKAFFEKVLNDFGEQQVFVDDDFTDTQFFSLTNYPNPFSSETTIAFSLATKSHENTRIEIYNIKGQKVKTLNIEDCKLNIREIVWDGKNENGNSVSNGHYFAKLKVGGEVKAVKKMVLLR